MSTVDERVAAGAAWLDEQYPGWVERIDPDRLDLSSCHACVIGQVVGDYFDLFDNSEEDEDHAAALGFQVDFGDDRGCYPHLEDAWRRLIEARRSS